MLRSFAVALMVAAIHLNSANADSLSLPTASNTNDARAQAIQNISTLIHNEDRYHVIKGKKYPLVSGANQTPGSLMEKLVMTEMQTVKKFSNKNQYLIAQAAKKLAPPKTIEDYNALYKDPSISPLYDTPLANDNSDENFGAQRTTLKGSNLRLVETDQYTNIEFDLTSEQVSQVCGSDVRSIDDVRTKEALFATDFSTIAKFNDPTQPEKYTPNVIGFFCYNSDARKLLPVAVRMVDTKLTYTPFDTAEEWELAKMAVNTADINHQQMRHLVETHMIFTPMKVEMMRTMSPQHPVYALVDHHLFTDFAVQSMAGPVLFSPNTPVDKTFGFGAPGCLDFTADQLKKMPFMYDFPTEVADRKIDRIPTHKFYLYGKQYYELMRTFVDGYLKTYYADDSVVQQDHELQQWAAQTSVVKDLNGFPSKFDSIESLSKLLTHIVFQHGVKHHVLNGEATWNSISLPFSAPAIWKEMPTSKVGTNGNNTKLNLLEYVPPPSNVPYMLTVGALFSREVKKEVTLFESYRKEPFASESKLKDLIQEFEKGLQRIDDFIVQNEQDEKYPYQFMRPSHLPYFPWI